MAKLARASLLAKVEGLFFARGKPYNGNNCEPKGKVEGTGSLWGKLDHSK